MIALFYLHMWILPVLSTFDSEEGLQSDLLRAEKEATAEYRQF